MQNKRTSKRNKAQAMVVVFIYISVVSLIGVYLMMYAANLNNMVVREINHTRAFYAGEAAVIRSYDNLCRGVGVQGVTDFAPVGVAVATAASADGFTTVITATVSNWQEW